MRASGTQLLQVRAIAAEVGGDCKLSSDPLRKVISRRILEESRVLQLARMNQVVPDCLHVIILCFAYC